jgi:hypothetical protein
VAAPEPIKALINKNRRAGTVTQNEKTLNQGMSISLFPSKTGNSKLPKEPIKIGIIEKKIITKA